ncbi:hypothetical protein OO17_23725 [Rhodopseudomonas palustris]|uniref:YncI copper-binding domain-containing protein n=2 Tax=Nitrobacteraceae TaxID=41294 RepID=A0A0D7E943_RHOPL|nr:hypothetical protein OO17_23725 [Rhodopseudomonas palustris]
MSGWPSAAMPLAALALIFGSAPAFAHVTLSPNEAAAGGYFQATFSVPHGCNGSATVALRIKVPDGVLSVKPQMKPGWSVDITTRKVDGAPRLHGKVITETVDEVSWRGGPLPDRLYDTFGLIMKLPDTPGKTLYFPVVQECESGVTRWIEIPAAGKDGDEMPEPAPRLRLKPKGS